MKIGSSIFDDEFLAFSVNKETKYGYTPVSGIMGLSENCILVECDPEAPARDNCERTCFSDPNLCRCRCGSCYDTFCDCNSPVPSEGLYEDYLARSDAYNFGDPQRVCPNPEQPPLLAMEDSASPEPECNCQKCPETGKPDPDPNADPNKCCGDALESQGECKCLKDEGCKVPSGLGPGATDTIPKGRTQAYTWTPDPANPGCYKCACPGETTPSGGGEGEPKKFWRCPQGEETECQETTDAKGTYSTPEECQQKVESGECEKRWVGLWNDHSDEGGYECREKPENFQWIGTKITEYNTQGECSGAVGAKEGSCGAYSTPTSTVYTGLGHCDSKWRCDASRVLYPGDPWKCRKIPSKGGADLYESDAECKKECCNGNYDETPGACSGNVIILNAKGQACYHMSRTQCSKQDEMYSVSSWRFDCLGECILPEGFECNSGPSQCEDGKIFEYRSLDVFFGLGSFFTECQCEDAPS
jgi:hypothetical protein